MWCSRGVLAIKQHGNGRFYSAKTIPSAPNGVTITAAPGTHCLSVHTDLTNWRFLGIITWIAKGDDKKSRFLSLFREPRLLRRGTDDFSEDGLGAGDSIGRISRVRPLLRFESSFSWS